MRSLRVSLLAALLSLFFSQISLAQSDAASVTEQQDKALEQHIEQLDAPLYSPFIERYLLDEVKTLRMDLERKHRELAEEVVDRELAAADKAVSYATDTVTYFFYLIAGASSVLVLIGWNSLREIKEKVHSVANAQVADLVDEYEKRLRVIESQLKKETAHIQNNREEISLTQELHSLWLRASQEVTPAAKILIYDHILELRPEDIEALTYKADAALDQGEPQWAINLCQQALGRDPENGHALYQMACALTAVNKFDEAARYFLLAVEQSDAYREELQHDEALAGLKDHPQLADI
ncbi:tetratricopeptide repeat protein [Spongiibacter sp. KMU-158]|uniref:Tetratricopeptide repeat protein n=1 Tax=Spongiibacter pelagi TaxID=2760804 RepID=A0A927GUF0_9GAMM|nr:tetratricopeptide repeat protein [Spongiibacter pelagi]MBD2857536.1 tetratricopeptide repeat protein [Spongiibacter pelagi]